VSASSTPVANVLAVAVSPRLFADGNLNEDTRAMTKKAHLG